MNRMNDTYLGQPQLIFIGDNLWQQDNCKLKLYTEMYFYHKLLLSIPKKICLNSN